ncbi:ATP-binding cassette domain-containing protein [Lichenihabitans sp. Uapishka_5]|uniref:ABC-F family ATP-binding cassette domain-containing protein n=1 Tax=Lichenihabitans sp. Uapishka_5 TaxID=3037302 RepID=UPI0029E7CF61|nr:ATP-binding cassette domain-containing protein [Lichenihabitans sp. Uapishka_5]MDX7953175.1 ATP-binding cassette domain-containing protein [Lichenihabitans sp. Uapishka_5]
MAAPPLLTLQNIRLTLGNKPLLDGADLSVGRGERLCLVGRNGSGKSTLLKVAAGELEQDGGARFMQPDANIRVLPQEPDLSGYPTTLSYVEAGLGPLDDSYQALVMLNELGLTGEENTASLSGGEARRAALARVMAPQPDILLLDEPTNHLDLPAIEWLESALGKLRSALVIISHDRRFLSNLSRATVWLDRGRTRRLDRGFSEFEAWRDQVLEEEERDRHKLERQIAREEDWLRYGVTARRKRNVRRLGALHDLKDERREAVKAVGQVKLSVSEGRTSGKMVIEADGVSKGFGARPIVKDFSTRVLRRDRIGVVGANGAGKSTLLKLLTGVLEPDQGTVKLGANLELASLDQGRTSLSPSTTLADALTGGGSDNVIINGVPKHVIGYMKDFLFGPEQARTPVERLSGGERGRLTLARALALPSNLLVLDEPTNDLDLETLDLLQEMVADYPGTVLVVSHDRDFLDRTVTAVITAEGGGVWTEYAGGYSDMVAQRGIGVEARTVDREASAGRTASEVPGTAEPKAAPPAAVGRNRKLNFNQKRALDTLPTRMEALRASMAKAQVVLNDPTLYSRDPERFAKASDLMAKAGTDLAAAEDEWLELEMLREEIGG